MELSRDIEDEEGCSGICKSSLFYNGNYLEKGPPKNTCLIPLKNEIFGDKAYNLGCVFVIAGVNALIMFLIHGINYKRPVEEEEKND